MTNGQREVARVLIQYPKGLPDHALVPLVQHVSGAHLSSSGIRTRRSELTHMGYVEARDTVQMPSGRAAAVWAVKPDLRINLRKAVR